jgi:hypothetical protein
LTKLLNQFVNERCKLIDVVDHCIFIFRIERGS